MKNILLLVHDDAGQEARLQAALDVTRALGGHLRCIDVAALTVITGDFYSGAASAVLLADEQEREGANKETLAARLAHEDVPWDWVDAVGPLADAVVEAAALADLIVLNRQLDSFPYPDMRDVASRILTHARKPVLAVPDTLERLRLDRALIAWDGQASAIATMRACVPLLSLAKEVEIFTIRDGSEGVGPTEAAEYLSRHGVHALVRVVNDKRHNVDQLIAREAKNRHADYVVMGAYSHGRMMEAFGGVTREMLTSSKVPLLLGH